MQDRLKDYISKFFNTGWGLEDQGINLTILLANNNNWIYINSNLWTCKTV